MTRLRQHTLSLLLALGACNHANCGENEAIRYASFLDPDVRCVWEHRDVDHAELDAALRTSGKELWFCQGNECRLLGPRVEVQRKR